MFQLLRRVSRSFLPRPDRPWRDDATSHAPTIGRKRRYSVTGQDVADSGSTPKKTKNDLVKLDTECDSASERESTTPVEEQDMKEVTNGVKEVDLEDEDKAADPSSMRPEGVPLPDSPSGSPEPEPESEAPELAKSDAVEKTTDAEDGGSVASLSRDDGAEDIGKTNAQAVTTDTDCASNENADIRDTPASLALEVEA